MSFDGTAGAAPSPRPRVFCEQTVWIEDSAPDWRRLGERLTLEERCFLLWCLFGCFRNTFKKEGDRRENCTAGYILGLLDSRTPKPNLSNRGTTLLLLLLQRGTKTRVTALPTWTRVRVTLAQA